MRIYFTLALGMTLCLLIVQRTAWPKGVRLAVGALPAIGGLAITLMLVPQFLGASLWYDRSPWRETILFGSMLVGMACRALSEAIELRRAAIAARPSARTKPPLTIDRWDFLYPFLASAITFAPIATSPVSQNIGIAAFVFSFQHGFFWQTILQRSAPSERVK